jgi:TonB family protein
MPRLRLVFVALAMLLAAPALHAQTAVPPQVPRDSASSAFLQRLAADARASAGAGAHGLVVFAAEPGGGRAELKLAHATVADSALAPVLQRARAGMSALAAAQPVVLHFRLDGAAGPAHPPARQPVIANAAEVRAKVLRFVSDHWKGVFEGRRGLRVDLTMVIAQEGDVAYARIARSSGNAQVDAAALEIARTMRFTPAQADGHPVDAVVTFPLHFVVGEA